jgi:hypothetical protein
MFLSLLPEKGSFCISLQHKIQQEQQQQQGVSVCEGVSGATVATVAAAAAAGCVMVWPFETFTHSFCSTSGTQSPSCSP